jgi:hypothetical protein
MLAANPTQLSLPPLRVLCVRRLPRPGRGVKTHLQPCRALSPQLSSKSRRIRTSVKFARNHFRMSSFKTKDLKLFRMSIYKKIGEGVPPARDAGLAERRDHLSALSAACSAHFVQARLAGISRPSRLKDDASGPGVKLAAAPDMTCWKAAWKRSISDCVPTVMRT